MVKTNFLFLFLFLSSCSRISEQYYDNQAQENYTSPYMGKWIGNYSGDETGRLVLEIYKSGRIEVARTYDNQQEIFYTEVFEGGSIYNSSSTNSGFTLYGNMEQKGGTWKKGSFTGIWSVTKQ